MGLAGPKIKQRIGADPRNLGWSNDQSKFGFKMLSKMGWTPGKGLGVDESGAQQHLTLAHKKDTLGVGADKKTIDNWLDTTSAFEDLLRGLNDDLGTEEKMVQSNNTTHSEKQQKKKKKIKEDEKVGRLAYRAKFIRSKKAAMMDTERLNEILGIKSTKQATIEKPADIFGNDSDSTESPLKADSSNGSNNLYGIKTNVNRMSTREYFAAKMKDTKKHADNPLIEDETTYEIPIDTYPPGKTKKKKRKSIVSINESLEDSGSRLNAETKSVKKRKKLVDH